MAVETYYCDGSDAAAAATSWTSLTNSTDGSTATNANYTNASISPPTYTATGTNAPSSGGTITGVRFRVYGEIAGDFDYGFRITVGGTQTNTLSYVTNGWGLYVTADEPAGGWTWAGLQAALFTGTYEGGSSGSRDLDIARIEIEVTYSSYNPAFAHRRLLL